MPAAWVSTQAGRHLSGRKAKHTAPEMALRRALHRRGWRFRVHVRLARGCTPDILFTRRRVAIFVDGCWWHGCPTHGARQPISGPNADLWADKFARNRERDRRSTELALGAGYAVLRFWECDVHNTTSAVLAEVEDLLLRHSALDASRLYRVKGTT